MAKEESEMIGELKKAGFNYVNSVTIFKKASLDLPAVNIILKWIPLIYGEDPGAAHYLVRALVRSREAFDPSVLIDLFENSDLNFSLKGGIGFTLVLAKTTDLSAWIKKQLLEEEYKLERCSLIPGLETKARFNSREELVDFLVRIFEKYYSNNDFIRLVKKYGDKNTFLLIKERTLTNKNTKAIREIEKVLVWYEKKQVKRRKTR